jgi:hypothetical protein
MSKLGNGYLFRIQRTNSIVEVDSRDVKFNETFSDCMDRKGRQIKGGKVLDPDLFNEPEAAYEIMKAKATWKDQQNSKAKPSRFSSINRFDNLKDDDDDEGNDNDEKGNDEDEGNDDEGNDDEGNDNEGKDDEASSDSESDD